MFYTLLFLTALLSQLQGGSAVSTQTRAISGRGSIAALNNLVVIGDGASTGGIGDISFSFYTYAVDSSNVVTALDYVQAIAGTDPGAGTPGGTAGAAANTVTVAAETDLAGYAFQGLGHDVAIADMSTVFVSQASSADKTGRVVVYEGNITSFEQTQLLIPYDGKHRQDSEAFFGGSISAKHDALAVGCQNCNSSAPVFSGGVYVYKPNKEGRWSESQVLSADGVLFLGERVAIHGNVLVAAGDIESGIAKTEHNFDNIANTVVVYEEGHHGKFEQRQVITTKSGTFKERISGLTVFDETIAITTMGTDLVPVTAAARDKVYIYYPMNKRYGLEPKGKPSPQQWTNIQILTSADVGHLRYAFGSPDTSISMNTLQYLTTDGTNVAKAKTHRECLSCKFGVPAVTAVNPPLAIPTVLLTSDSTAFYTFQTTAVANGIDDPEPNSFEDKCLTISLQDQYNDGWGIASLLVTDPNGREDRFTLQCTTANPNVFKYCPQSQLPGKYNLHIEKGEETPFGWEIIWKVAAGSSWYYGDRHTHMDFIWEEKYEDFHVGATKGLLPLVDTCTVCDPNKPQGKHRSLSNLRSLHHKGKTASPTNTQFPTITATGYGSFEWNEFVFIGSTAWFDSDYNGAAFFISDPEGRHLHRTGTSCTGDADQKCWVELPDGDYTIRVGASIADTGMSTLTYAFCGSSVGITMDSEMRFTVLDQQCYPGAFYEVETYCLNTYKSSFYLNVDLVLGGAVDTLSATDESTLKIALSETMLSVLGTVPSSVQVGLKTSSSSGLRVHTVLQFDSTPDATALDSFVKETSSANSLLKYELIGTQALSANFLKGEVSGVTIVSASTNTDARDMSTVDETSFNTVTDYISGSPAVEQSDEPNNFNVYAEYIAEGAYALVAVAAVVAVSLLVKRAVAAKTAQQEEASKA